MAKTKAKAKTGKKRKTGKKKTKSKKRAHPKGTKNAYARRTKKDIAENGPSLHTNGFDLTDQQMLFVDKYLCAAELNQTKAAIAAGYSKKSAQSQASALMVNPRVKAYLRKRMDDRRRRVQATSDKLIESMAAIALFKPSEFVDVRNGCIIVKDLTDIPIEIQGAVRSYEPVFGKHGSGIKVRFNDPIAATKLLMQHLGMLEVKARDGSKGTIVEFMDRIHGEAEGAREE